jgi:hypothetical protein
MLAPTPSPRLPRGPTAGMYPVPFGLAGPPAPMLQGSSRRGGLAAVDAAGQAGRTGLLLHPGSFASGIQCIQFGVHYAQDMLGQAGNRGRARTGISGLHRRSHC